MASLPLSALIVFRCRACHALPDLIAFPTLVLGQIDHYQVPSAEYSSYTNHVTSLGLAQDYVAQLHASCSSNSPPPLGAAINQACRHLSGAVDDLQPVPVSVHEVPSLETWGQQNGAPVPDAAVGLAAAIPNVPEEEARILRLTQLTMPVMVQLSHRTQSRLRNQLPSSGGLGAAWPYLLF